MTRGRENAPGSSRRIQPLGRLVSPVTARGVQPGARAKKRGTKNTPRTGRSVCGGLINRRRAMNELVYSTLLEMVIGKSARPQKKIARFARDQNNGSPARRQRTPPPLRMHGRRGERAEGAAGAAGGAVGRAGRTRSPLRPPPRRVSRFSQEEAQAAAGNRLSGKKGKEREREEEEESGGGGGGRRKKRRGCFL